ncbi:MAG: copper chaperone PCu(A)C [Cellvibrionaceae bacterium]|nr:copper chaperone PCu(A)C [Cellvibrionaceae bacterium]
MKIFTLIACVLCCLSGCNKPEPKNHNKTEQAYSPIEGLSLSHAYIRATAPHMKNTVMYFTLMNRQDRDIYLTAVSSKTIERIELHEHRMHDGLMTMQKVDRVKIPKKSTVLFEPGGYHIMLMDIGRTIAAGEKIAFTLLFDGADSKTITAIAKKNINTQQHDAHADY